MNINFVLIAAAFLVASCTTTTPPVQSATTPSLTKLQARSMDEAALRNLVLAQFGETLIEYPRPQQGKPKRPLTHLFYWTRPRAADTENLCIYDSMHFEFSSPPGQPEDSTAIARVSGINASPYFFLIGETDPSSAYQLNESKRPELDKKCAEHSPLDMHSIEADNDDALVRFLGLIDRIRALDDDAMSQVKTICMHTNSDQPCTDLVRRALQIQPSSVKNCNGERENLDEFLCDKGEFEEYELTIFNSFDSPLPTEIVLRERVILMHEMAE